MENYEVIRDLGAGSFGITKLCKHKQTKKLVAIKFIQRGPKINRNVEREIINDRWLWHENIVRFLELILTQTHLGIVMEYAAGGELFERVRNFGRFSEDEARYFFQQLVSGMNYIHSMEICHRDLKLDNILLEDEKKFSHLKICDFGYSKKIYDKDSMLDNTVLDRSPSQYLMKCEYGFNKPLYSNTKTKVGSVTYAAPEVLAHKQYDGKLPDVWSCGVILYVLLVAEYPNFEYLNHARNFQKTTKRRITISYNDIVNNIHIPEDCQHLLSCIFIRKPSKRISVNGIRCHPWYLKNLHREWTEPTKEICYRLNMRPRQNVKEILEIIENAKRKLPPSSTSIMGYMSTICEDDEADLEEEEEDEEDEYDEKIVKEVPSQ